jgi:5-hydroxyisourate hydrolase-like protein (transthyretin family)
MSKQVLRNLSLILGLICCVLVGLMGLQSKTGQAATSEQVVPASPDDWGYIAGTVRGQDGSPLKNIVVQLRQAGYPSVWGQVGTTQTDAAGRYAFVQLGPGSYRVGFQDLEGVYANQYYAQAATAESAATLTINGNKLNNVDAQLAAAGSIEGSILGPLAAFATNMTVGAYTLVGGQWQFVSYSFVDEDLQYKIQGLPPGTYHVCAADVTWYAGYPPCYDRIGGGVAWGTDVVVTSGSSAKGIDLTTQGLQDAATISGTVTGQTGMPLQGIRVSAMVFNGGGERDLWRIATAETDEAGVYRLGDLAAGDYVVQFQDSNGPYVRQYFKGTSDVYKAQLITLARLEQRRGVDDRLELGGTISGTLSFAGPYPPARATVTATEWGGEYDGSSYSASYDPDSGQYVIRQLPPGQYTVLAQATDLINEGRLYVGFYSDGAPDGGPTHIVVTGGSTIGGIDIQLAQGDYAGVISGTVTSENGQLLAGMRVDLLKSASWDERAIVYALTDAAGRYQFDGIPDGGYYLRYSDPAGVYAPVYAFDARRPDDAKSIRVIEGSTEGPIDARLLRGGWLRGQVRTAAGKPIKGATVRLMLEQNTVTAVTTDALGNYDSGPLPPGSYQVCAEASINSVHQYSCLGYEYGASWPGLQVPLQAEETVQEDLVFGYVPQLPYKQYLPDVARFTWP